LQLPYAFDADGLLSFLASITTIDGSSPSPRSFSVVATFF